MRVLKDFIIITMEKQPKEVIELVMKYVDTAYQIGNMETKDIGYCVGYQSCYCTHYFLCSFVKSLL